MLAIACYCNLMDTLLTAKQVQDILRVDRTTIYRMLKDGRLNGVKVGQQWRFVQREVDDMLAKGTGAETLSPLNPEDVLPLHCVQTVQDVFAEIAQVGAITVNKDGLPLTKFSNSNGYCKLLLGSPPGRQAAIESWSKLKDLNGNRGGWLTCCAGTQFTGVPIQVEGQTVAYLVSGEFYTHTPNEEEKAEQVNQIAERFGLDREALEAAVADVPVLDEAQRTQLTKWLRQVAHTFEEVAAERATLMSRLKQIAAMTDLSS